MLTNLLICLTLQHINSMKRQKDMTLKYEIPRLVGVQHSTGEEWRNNSRKSEDVEPKWKQCPVVDVYEMFNAVKRNTV